MTDLTDGDSAIGAQPTTLILVRHGETQGNREGRFQTYDVPLSKEGRAQAERVAARLAAGPRVHAIYSSDLRRTMETAAIIGARLGLAPVADPALRELDVGDWKGVMRTELEERHPGFLEQWVAGGGVERMPGPAGECVADVARRVSAFFDAVVARHRGERVVLVSHGWALTILLAYVHGWDHAEAFSSRRVILGNTALSIVEVDEAGERRCTLLGCTEHLDEAVGSRQPAVGP